MKRLIVLIIAILVPTAVVAKGECNDDVEKFCKGIDAKPQLTACMEQHDAELSPACRAARAAHAAKKKP